MQGSKDFKEIREDENLVPKRGVIISSNTKH